MEKMLKAVTDLEVHLVLETVIETAEMISTGMLSKQTTSGNVTNVKNEIRGMVTMMKANAEVARNGRKAKPNLAMKKE